MSQNREDDISRVFVSLASSLARGNDVLDLLSSLTTDCARLLDVSSAGLLLADRQGVLHVLAASSERTRNLEIFQLQREQGPCLDCFFSGSPVTVENLLKEAARWPQFAEAAIKLGFASVHALPMRLRDTRLGALGLFGTTVGPLNEEDLRLGQAFADVASVAIVQNMSADDKETLNQQLQSALNSRVIVEQAKGILAQTGSLDMDEAFGRLRRYTRDHNYRLSDVARALVSRELPAETLLGYVASRSRAASSSEGRTA